MAEPRRGTSPAGQRTGAEDVLFRAIAESSAQGVWVVGPDGRTAFVNERMAEIAGVPREVLLERIPLEGVAADIREDLRDRMQHREARGAESYEVEYQQPAGRTRTLQVSAAPLHDQDGRYLGSLGLVNDVTDDRERQEALRRLAVEDELTGLANRRMILGRINSLEAEAARDSTVAMMFIDLDRFSLVNDSLGILVGDAVLKAAAERLATLAQSDDTIARLGSDEFLLLMTGSGAERAPRLARETAAAFQRPLELPGRAVHVGASVGVALGPAAHAPELVRRARNALGQAKTRGGGQAVVFDPALASALDERLAIGSQLRAAVRSGGLSVHYQPVVALGTGEVIGLEALVRWQHPTLGPIPPTNFVAVAEEVGCAGEMDAWVLAEACAELARLRAAGVVRPEVYMSVNTSAGRIQAEETVSSILQALEQAGVPADRLCVEVTETQAMNDPGAAAHVLRRLREAGVQVAIDDFGTGHASLAYLREFPTDHVKIDRSFIERIATDADDLALAASIIDLARVTGVQAIAEGVETAEQMALLRRLGCPAGQGYLWSAPVDSKTLAATLTGLPRGRFGTRPSSARTRLPFDRTAPEAEPVISRIMELHRTGASVSTIAAAMNAEGLRTTEGRRWHRASVARVIARAAYQR